MLNRAAKNRDMLPAHSNGDPVQKMHRNLTWAIGTGTVVLIVNVVTVVAVV